MLDENNLDGFVYRKKYTAQCAGLFLLPFCSDHLIVIVFDIMDLLPQLLFPVSTFDDDDEDEDEDEGMIGPPPPSPIVTTRRFLLDWPCSFPPFPRVKTGGGCPIATSHF